MNGITKVKMIKRENPNENYFQYDYDPHKIS